MKCDRCGADNPIGMIRCRQCGALFLKKCPNCQTENESKAKFCKSCGWPLTGTFSKTNKSLCARCHTPIDYGIPNCPSCGAPLSWQP